MLPSSSTLQGGSIMMDGLTGRKDLPFPVMETVSA